MPTCYAGTAFPLKNSPLQKNRPKHFRRLSYTGNIANRDSINTKVFEEEREGFGEGEGKLSSESFPSHFLYLP